MDRITFKNARIILLSSIIENGYLVIEDGKISDFGEGDITAEAGSVIDVGGDWLSPGLIETHAHGGGGADFMDGTEEAFFTVSLHHAAHGVTSMLATTLAGDITETEKVLTAFSKASGKIMKCNMLGVHLEGPYFSEKQRGAQDAKYIKAPDKNEIERFLSYGCIKRITMAPELKGAVELGRYLSENGILASVGHTDADFDTVELAVNNGFSLMTHIYSGMSGVRINECRRVAGTIEAGLCIDELTVEMICDGIHLPAPLLKLIYKCKGKDKIILTSDASRGAGLPDGTVIKLGSIERGQDVIIKNGVANRMDMTGFAGSVISGDDMLRNVINAIGIPAFEAVQMAAYNPARLLGISDKKGKIGKGMDADLAVFSPDFHTKLTVVGGKVFKVL